MSKIVKKSKLRNIMTLATDLNYSLFPNSILFMGYYCLSSVAMAKEAIPELNLSEGQVVITSPMIGSNELQGECIIYKKINIDVESGLFIPIVSWAYEFTKYIINCDKSVYMDNTTGLVESLLMQVWKYEEVNISTKGLKIDLLQPMSWESIYEEEIGWDDYDSIVNAETIIKDGSIELNTDFIPHAHVENIQYFHKEQVSRGIIFDW